MLIEVNTEYRGTKCMQSSVTIIFIPVIREKGVGYFTYREGNIFGK